MEVMNRIKPHMQLIERIMGALLIFVGITLATGAFSAFANWLQNTIPFLAGLG
jgi:cytochrome c-type biogenesis protein